MGLFKMKCSYKGNVNIILEIGITQSLKFSLNYKSLKIYPKQNKSNSIQSNIKNIRFSFHITPNKFQVGYNPEHEE